MPTPLPIDVHLTLPDWIREAIDPAQTFADDAAKVGLAIELSRRNVAEGTGGPFGAVAYGPDHRVVAAAVNGVLRLSSSIAHAETLALTLAQQRLGRPRLNRDAESRAIGPYTLAASSQPCCQCYGAAIWAGLDRLVIGARADDVTTLTDFDEGPLPDDWIGELQRRGIEVVGDVSRDRACEVLRAYAASGGARY